MEINKTLKAISNPKRMEILSWLKNPALNFPPHKDVDGFDLGVCVANIKVKSGLSQSTTSQYMSMMENAGLVISTRIGKWTYYRRNEVNISEFTTRIKNDL